HPKKATPALGGTGRPVIVAGSLPVPGKIFVLSYVSKRGAREFNTGQLQARGYVAGRDFLLCA
ncbi:MAG: glycosyltransferase family 2 protein, partial [Verrucomicrobiota bacterium]